ncbi:type II toxin-antitoxin system PemK/MazF family toxin [Candidatus Pacearchaeota archaeon]|nr:type II toxin-antitoxin system PemK/MazF family toxin [Candidatus Pacearchaeota archaeon]
MKNGKMLRSGDVILAETQFTDTFEIKKRPVLVLFEEYDNIVVAGITSNIKMEGIFISRKDGAIKDSVIKLNYIFTISKKMASKILFHLNSEKKKKVFDELTKKLKELIK